MDNIVIDVKEDASKIAVVLDLEQGRNIYNWAPPEVYYWEWIAELGSPNHMRTDHLPQETVAHYSEILKRYLALKGHGWPLPGEPDVYDNPTHGWYYPWTLSTQEEREAGMVFLLAKALWCIFEGREEGWRYPWAVRAWGRSAAIPWISSHAMAYLKSRQRVLCWSQGVEGWW